MSPGVCSLCRRPVIWATTVYEKSIPLDPEPDPDGNQAVYRDVSGALRTRQLKKGQEAQPFEKLHMVHIASCPARRRPTSPVPLPSNVIPINRNR